jgi:hypothetical protein
MSVKRQSSNIVAMVAILLGFLVLGGFLLLTPSEFHLNCTKDACNYRASAVLGPQTTWQFPTRAIAYVSTYQTHSRSGTTYHVYLKEADQQLEVSKFNHQRDADALANRIRRFLQAPSDAPLKVDYNNNPGMLLGFGFAGFAMLLGLFFAGLKGKSPITIRLITNVQVKQRQRQP